MTQPKIWHNPRCSKSRQTLAILEDAGFKPEIVKYLEANPSAAEIQEALNLLGVAPNGLIRKSERIYKENNLKGASDEELVSAMAENPILIERPVVFHNGKAALGRPPESVNDIL